MKQFNQINKFKNYKHRLRKIIYYKQKFNKIMIIVMT